MMRKRLYANIIQYIDYRFRIIEFIFNTSLRDLWSLSGPLRVRKMQPDIQKVVTLLRFDVKSIYCIILGCMQQWFLHVHFVPLDKEFI